MEKEVKQTLDMIIHERLKIKATLENLRMLEALGVRRYEREINFCLDRMRELDDLYEKIEKK